MAEVVASLPISDNWSIDGNVTWMDAMQQSGADRPYRPEETGRVSLTWKRSVVGRLTARHTGKATGPFGTPIDDTTTLDLSGDGRSRRGFTEARLLNLTDQTISNYRLLHAGFTRIGARINL